MRKKLLLLILTIFIFGAVPAQSADIQELLSKIGFNISAEKNPEKEITKVIEKQQNYANKKKFDKIKPLFSSDYANFDGISLDDYIASLKKSEEMQSKIEYKTEIKSISVNGDYATVYVIDTSKGITKEPYKDVEGKGVITSKSDAVYYLKKEDGDWKISADMVFSEKTTLKYGSAKDVEINIYAPECVKENTEYNIKVSADLPENTGMIVALFSEPIEYPQPMNNEDIYRPVKRGGEIERVVVSNKDGKNEIAFASVAIAKAQVGENSQVEVTMEGVAFVATRVNVIPGIAKKAENNDKKEDKVQENGEEK